MYGRCDSYPNNCLLTVGYKEIVLDAIIPLKVAISL